MAITNFSALLKKQKAVERLQQLKELENWELRYTMNWDAIFD